MLGERIFAPARKAIAADALPQAAAACELLASVMGGHIGDVAAPMAALAEPSVRRALEAKSVP